jgi:hypothetical protein
MGRPKGSKNKTPRKVAVKKVAKKKTARKTARNKKVFGPDVWQRDEHGLLKNVDYVFKEDGSIDWKLMLPKEYLYINEDWFVQNQQDVPDSPDGLKDEQIIVGLAALKEIAKVRGLVSCEMNVDRTDTNHATCTCRLEFIPNYETCGKTLVYEAVANASAFNVSDYFQIYLETIASNRAFGRAVRNALRIDIVSDTELSSPQWISNSVEGTGIELWRSLAEACKKTKFIEIKNKDDGQTTKHPIDNFDAFKKYLLYRGSEDATGWDSWKDIPNDKCLLYLGKLKEKESSGNT